MFEKKADPRDAVILVLREQLAAERLKNDDLHRQLLALYDKAAFRVVHPKASDPIKSDHDPSIPGDPRKKTYVMKNSYQAISELAEKKLES